MHEANKSTAGHDTRCIAIDAETLTPVGILGSDLSQTEKNALMWLWHQSGCFHRTFYCHPVEVLSRLAIRSRRTAVGVFSALQRSRLLAIHDENSGGGLRVEVTENIRRLNLRASQPTLELFAPPAEFGGCPQIPKLLLPVELLASPNATQTQKCIIWGSLWRGNVHAKTFRIVYHEWARLLGMDRSNLRKVIWAKATGVGNEPQLRVELTEFLECLEAGPEPLLRWFPRIFSDQQRNELEWLLLSDVAVANAVANDLCEVIGAPVLPRLAGTTHVSPRSEVIGTTQSEVIGAPALPRLLETTHDLPRSEVIRAPVLPFTVPTVPPSAGPVPHDYEDDMNDMLCGTDRTDEAARVTAREKFILGFADRIDFTETNCPMVRAWALMAETDRVVGADGKVLKLDASNLESILRTAAEKYATGEYVTGAYVVTCISGELRLGATEKTPWGKLAEKASREIGLACGRDWRAGKIGGERPVPPRQPTAASSRATRGGDQLDSDEKRRGDRIRELKAEGLSHQDAVAKADDELRGQE